jgi:hypothetical protein
MRTKTRVLNPVLFPRPETRLMRIVQRAIAIAIPTSMMLLLGVGLLGGKELGRVLLMLEGVILFLFVSLSMAIQVTLQWAHSKVVAAYTLMTYLIIVGLLLLGPFFRNFWPHWVAGHDLIFTIVLIVMFPLLEVLRVRSAGGFYSQNARPADTRKAETSASDPR